jgi:CheY-like chemotaxis protein
MNGLSSVPDKEKRTILVVEDELLVRLVGADALSDAGYEVIEAESAAEALHTLENASEVHLLFTDIRMPGGMNGLQLADEVHRRWPGIKILITSGDTFPKKSRIPDDGHFLPKPYGIDVLQREVESLFEG